MVLLGEGVIRGMGVRKVNPEKVTVNLESRKSRGSLCKGGRGEVFGTDGITYVKVCHIKHDISEEVKARKAQMISKSSSWPSKIPHTTSSLPIHQWIFGLSPSLTIFGNAAISLECMYPSLG